MYIIFIKNYDLKLTMSIQRFTIETNHYCQLESHL